MKKVVRTLSYRDDLNDIEAFIAKDNTAAALDMWFLIDDQLEKLADSKFPRRPRRVAHENYVVILEEDSLCMTVLKSFTPVISGRNFSGRL